MSLPCTPSSATPAVLLRARQDAQAFMDDHPADQTPLNTWMCLVVQLSRRAQDEVNRSMNDHPGQFSSFRRRLGERLNERPEGFDAVAAARQRNDVATVVDLLRSSELDAFDIDSLYRRALNAGQLEMAKALEPHADQAYPHQALLSYLNNRQAPVLMTEVERLAQKLTRQDWLDHGGGILSCAVAHEVVFPSPAGCSLVRQIQAQNQSLGVRPTDKELYSLMDSLVDAHGRDHDPSPMIEWVATHVFTHEQLNNLMDYYVGRVETRRTDLFARYAPAHAQDRWLSQYAASADALFPWLCAKRQAEDRAVHAETQLPAPSGHRRRRA